MAVTRQTVENPDVLYKHSKWVALPLYLPLQFPAKFALLGISSRGAGQKMKSLSFRSESRSFEAEARPQRVLKNLEVRTSRAVEPKDQTYFIAAELGRSPVIPGVPPEHTSLLHKKCTWTQKPNKIRLPKYRRARTPSKTCCPFSHHTPCLSPPCLVGSRGSQGLQGQGQAIRGITSSPRGGQGGSPQLVLESPAALSL